MLRLDEDRAAALIPAMLKHVSEERRRAAERFRRPIDAYRSLLGETLARLAVCELWQVSNADLSFRKNAYGKPLLDYPPNCSFNISHSGEWVVCAASDTPVGIDVERIKPIDISIAERFFAPEEYDELMKLSGSRQLSRFYRLWTLKESYIKAVGKGMSIPLDSFAFAFLQDGSVTIARNDAEAPAVWLHQHSVDDCHMLALCASEDSIPAYRMLSVDDAEAMFPLLGQHNGRHPIPRVQRG
jgi:4'-phosphopantetheinyl transferase